MNKGGFENSLERKRSLQTLGFIGAIRTIIDATTMETHDKQKLLALVQNQQGTDDDDAELGAPDPAAYKSKSGGI